MTGSLVSIPDNANLLEALEFFILSLLSKLARIRKFTLENIAYLD
jgi:hypothetical protein